MKCFKEEYLWYKEWYQTLSNFTTVYAFDILKILFNIYILTYFSCECVLMATHTLFSHVCVTGEKIDRCAKLFWRYYVLNGVIPSVTCNKRSVGYCLILLRGPNKMVNRFEGNFLSILVKEKRCFLKDIDTTQEREKEPEAFRKRRHLHLFLPLTLMSDLDLTFRS